MQLYYHKDPRKNFGDDLNEWIWDELIPSWQDWPDEVTLFGVGTILNKARLDAFRHKRLLVIGSGVGYNSLPVLPFPKTWDIQCVRGPRSAKALNIDEERGICDPAVMLSEIEELRARKKTPLPLFIPHVDSVDRHEWKSICSELDIEYVSPCGESKGVIQKIAEAPLVIAESMHAAIIADTFRVPWIAVRISENFNQDKWRDWSESLQIDLKIHTLFPSIEFFDENIPLKRYRQYRKKLRIKAEQNFISTSLQRVSMLTSTLSLDSVLEDKKERFYNVLRLVSQRYNF